ncbi:uncharacterized protein LOC117182331 [Belonocnema kinseyi]|uniref:uncharacterized protein LOC117182331 n=1 Tax=Belonocnema kinseyi TaxID=2817044 RepID=UPI00143CCDFC|nr:uncharacterized protein LOC117182331 [Belonocnema kinseyi]
MQFFGGSPLFTVVLFLLNTVKSARSSIGDISEFQLYKTYGPEIRAYVQFNKYMQPKELRIYVESGTIMERFEHRLYDWADLNRVLGEEIPILQAHQQQALQQQAQQQPVHQPQVLPHVNALQQWQQGSSRHSQERMKK